MLLASSLWKAVKLNCCKVSEYDRPLDLAWFFSPAQKKIMQFIKLCIVFVTLRMGTCMARQIFEIHKSDDSPKLVDATVKVLTSCYKKQTGAIGFAGKSSETLVRALWLRQSRPAVLIDHTTRDVMNGPMLSQLPYKLELFVVVASPSSELLQILGHMKESQWWNHMASFLIIEPLPRIGCSNAYESLQTAWKMNLLHAKFMCFDQTYGSLIHGYNPYTKKAPKSWQLVTTFAAENNHPWALLKRAYQDNRCDELDFDKTVDLDGYHIRAIVKTVHGFDIDFNKTGVDSFSGLNGLTAQILFRAMHANVALHVHNATDGVGYLDRNDRHIVMNVVDGHSDILLNPLFQSDAKNLTFSIPFIQSGDSILTHYSSEMSQLRKTLSFIDANSRYGVLGVFFITSIFFKIFRGEDSVTTILNLVRLLCNSCLVKVPTNGPARVYLISFFLFSITIQALYQGQLSSRLTKTMFLPDVDSLEDLARQGHTIYGGKGLAYLFSDPPFKGRYIVHDGKGCTEDVLRDPKAACVRSRVWLIPEAKKHKLHLSRDSFRIMNIVYVIRDDWPLEQRFNMVISAMIEAGVIQRAQINMLDRVVAENEFYKKLKAKDKYEVITLVQLKFAFVILGIGLLLATVCLIAEVAIAWQVYRQTL